RGDVSRRTFEANAQARLACHVPIKLGGLSVLRDCQIDPAILVEVTQCRAALFPVNSHSRDLSGHGGKSSSAIASEPQTSAGAERFGLWWGFEEVLSKKEVFVPVAVDVGNTQAKHRRELRLRRQQACFKARPAIEENH